MAIDAKEKNFEEDIEAWLTSPEGGYLKGDDQGYQANPGAGVDIDQLVSYIVKTQEKIWKQFVKRCGEMDPKKEFLHVFRNAVSTFGMLQVLKRGFKHRGLKFKVVSFKPESHLNETDRLAYEANQLRCIRQFHYSAIDTRNTVDIVLDINGIPVVALELKDEFTGQTTDNARIQWMKDRNSREEIFRFNSRILAFFAVDLSEVYMTTKLNGMDTVFLPFNQGSNGAGRDGDVGNPPNPYGYQTSYLWEKVLQADSLLDIINRYMNLEEKETKEVDSDGIEHTHIVKRLIFPRYHQLDCVRKIIADVRENGAGKSYLIQHSAGSGKSNSIAWTAYRLSTMSDEHDHPVFDGVVVVTDRKILDRQLQSTISGFGHAIGQIEVIDGNKTSQDLFQALKDGRRLIISTLQKYSVIYNQLSQHEFARGKRFCIIIDEAHSSQTGSHAAHLKQALADPDDVLEEYAQYEEQCEEDNEEILDGLLQSMFGHGHASNLTFVAFTATPKEKTLELFGVKQPDGSYRPFHVYSMRQAINEGFILDPLANYMTYSEALKIASRVPENPECPTSPTLKLLRRYTHLHPYALAQKAQIIVETYRNTTRHKIGGRGKMMVVTDSRLAAVRYYHEIKRYMSVHGYDDMEILVAFSGSLKDPLDGVDGPEYTEGSMNVGHDDRPVKESQTVNEFHNWGSVLVAAEKYQTGFDEPLLHTLIIDKKLRREKAVQTICRIDRTCPGKDDTLVIDFANSRQNIEDAFQPFYTTTSLEGSIDTDKLYKLEDELRKYRVYTDEEIERTAELEFGKDRSNVQGRIKSLLTPAVERYNALEDDDRYLFRRKTRNFIKWYGYVTQLVRMFDMEMQKEYVFLGYLSHLLTVDKVDVSDVDHMVQLDYYKLEQTWKGSIELEDKEDELKTPRGGREGGMNNDTDPLDVLIRRINDEYAGDFTDADRVVVSSIYKRASKDPNVQDSLKHDTDVVFDDTWPNLFNDAATKAFMENQDAYEGMFKDKDKYATIMHAVGEMLKAQVHK